jgi:hypothetical protein
MDDNTAIVGENVEIIQTTGGWAAISWSAAIAGAVAATAVTLILVALGSGIGLAIASPFSGPSAGTMTAAGAIWLVLAQSAGFAAGGFVAGRLRTRISPLPTEETRFRDGANGFMAWAIGVVVAASVFAAATAFSVVMAARAAGTATAGVVQGIAAVSQSDDVGYFVDTLTRSNARGEPANAEADRAQVTRIVTRSIRDGRLSDDDKAYLAGLVASRTGVSPEDAQRRVDDVVNRARDSVKQAADTARKAGAYVAFWTFMSLLFGAVAATLAGVLGGELRDEGAGLQPPVLVSG